LACTESTRIVIERRRHPSWA